MTENELRQTNPEIREAWLRFKREFPHLHDAFGSFVAGYKFGAKRNAISNYKVGNIFGYDHRIDVAISWAIVREHPDDENLFLLVPLDDFFLVGSHDVNLGEQENHPLVARCGYSVWLDISALQKMTFFESSLKDESIKLIRKKLRYLVLPNPLIATKELEVDCDPNYEEHLEETAKASEQLNVFMTKEGK